MGEDSVCGTERYTSRAGLCALGLYLARVRFWDPMETVRVPQKTVRYRPVDKLKTLVCLLLSGGEHIVETNRKVRADASLCQAFGCAPCEQSVLSDTLSACTQETVESYRSATGRIFARFSKAVRHDFTKGLLVLDVDLSGLVCGKGAEGATKGYFAGRKRSRGRQEGRVLATHYDEVVTEEVYAGTKQLGQALPALMQAAQDVLCLTGEKRARTLVRTDGGGGTKEDLCWLVERGYQVLTKVYAHHTATALRKRVRRWIDDPRTPGRQVGMVEAEPSEWDRKPFMGFPRCVTLVGLRFSKDNGKEGGAVIATTLSPQEVLALCSQRPESADDTDTLALAVALLYDQRGGGIETAFKEDKQALSLSRCNKRGLSAQKMISASIALAHNITVWAKGWLEATTKEIGAFGILRLTRDVFGIRGKVALAPSTIITFAQSDPFAQKILTAFRGLFVPNECTLHLGQI